MSNPPRISYVVEGTTDYLVLDALVELFLDKKDYVPIQIQPPISDYADNLGLLGGGWKGVLKWCADAGASQGGLAGSIALANCDCLIIHVDADIAAEDDLNALDLSEPCPPAKATCDNIRKHLVSLLGGQLPHKVVLCVPAQCTEAWVFAALHSDLLSTFQPVECRTEVENLLIGKPDRLVRSKDGRARKQTDSYRNVADKIAAQWPKAITACAEALRFDIECRASLP